MKIPAIKKLVENVEIDALRKAEQDLLEEQKPEIQIDGEDESEQLTHVLAAIIIKEYMANGLSFTDALRKYSSRVRTSIS
jgi:broad-specificity NMP kinase